ncbi:MAG: penicillin-insensitive murein endopeptidase [Polyangiaceae bacterium]
MTLFVRAALGHLAAFGLLGCLTLGCTHTPNPLSPAFSGTIGVPHSGLQTGAVELPRRGKGFARYRPYSDHYWGQPRLVAAVERAAAKVHDEFPGGKPLLLGDLSAEGGGKIPGHHSHRTGRDIDLLWYVTTPSGAPVVSPGFIKLREDGLAQVGADFYALDMPREWALIKALILDPEASVQWMFCSQEIEALIIDYARAKGEPDALLWYAETVLHQPRDSAPHDDHIHMRFACSEAEAVRGCIGGGPYWEFLPGEETPEPSDDELLAMALAEPPLPPIDAEPGPEPTTEPTPGPTTEPTAAAATP